MLLSTHDVVMILFCVKCSGHVYYYVRKVGGGGGKRREFLGQESSLNVWK